MPEKITRKTRIILADDHEVVLKGIRRILRKYPEFEIAGLARDGQETVELVKSCRPDIVILDISMPNMDGVEAAREIKRLNKQIKIIVYSMVSDAELVTLLFREGISGYVLKSLPVSGLVAALSAVREGGTFYSDEIRDIISDYMQDLATGTRESSILERLSTREKEVFVLLADGRTPKEIGDRLFISPKTVETHKYNIMEKLEAKSLSQLTKIAFKFKLIEI